MLPKSWRNPLLLFASYVFYGYWDYRFTSLLAISTIIDFTVGQKLFKSKEPKTRKNWLMVSLFANLGILAVFKYYGFFISSFEPLAAIFGGKLDYLHLNIILPVGISFYTFQTMSYTIDIYRNRLQPTNNFIDFAVFVSFFPQLVAGPIERASNLLPQIAKRPMPSRDQIEKGIVLIVTGLFKKVMIGDTTGRIVDHIFSQPDIYKSPELLAALVLFSIQIYADFSGYSSIARGTAKLLGIELMKNFEQPYLSQNITEFWRRWHISLSSWLRDYLYISLGGNRKGVNRTYINLMLTMLLGGLWHGASWNFVIWGGLHGIYLAIHKLILGNKKVADRFQYKGLGSLLKYLLNMSFTFVLVLFTWLFFRATDFHTASTFISKMIHWESSEFAGRILIITLSFAIMIGLFDFFEYYTKRHTFLLMLKNKGLVYGILLALLLVSFLFMFQSEALPFIYFQF
ncbi:MBOAT family protein [Lentimicrobium sp. S6]|uniref:MBOAT family O-acyltransferase n=1 Tax=Lentimicrobium sp. S6 TaxID=2735872 RepID=UPI001C12D734|nr:MBOAT family O-acyltransferase [Lentimicrobium sp. S6]